MGLGRPRNKFPTKKQIQLKPRLVAISYFMAGYSLFGQDFRTLARAMWPDSLSSKSDVSRKIVKREINRLIADGYLVLKPQSSLVTFGNNNSFSLMQREIIKQFYLNKKLFLSIPRTENDCKAWDDNQNRITHTSGTLKTIADGYQDAINGLLATGRLLLEVTDAGVQWFLQSSRFDCHSCFHCPRWTVDTCTGICYRSSDIYIVNYQFFTTNRNGPILFCPRWMPDL